MSSYKKYEQLLTIIDAVDKVAGVTLRMIAADTSLKKQCRFRISQCNSAETPAIALKNLFDWTKSPNGRDFAFWSKVVDKISNQRWV